MNTLLIGSGNPVHLRHPFVSESELFSSPAVTAEPGCVFRPAGDFDLPGYLRLMPDPWRKPDLLVTLYGVGDAVPRNLAGVPCPKIMIVSDTHHGPAPLTSAVRAATQESYDLVVLQYTPQHVHWFQEAGCKRVAWIPCFGIRPFDPNNCGKAPLLGNRQRGATFVGATGQNHPRRVAILKELEKRGVKVEWHTGTTQEEAAKIHAESTVCLNIALNNDFNLRNFEVMAAGGCLLTERVSACILDDGDNCRLWSTVDELAKLCKYYLRQPARAMALAQAGYDCFWNEHEPTKKRAALMSALAMTPNPTPKPYLWERLAAYEAVQEMRRTGMGMDDLEDLR